MTSVKLVQDYRWREIVVLKQAAVKCVRQTAVAILLRQWDLDQQGLQITVRCDLVAQC
jgi:hypothetical protein